MAQEMVYIVSIPTEHLESVLSAFRDRNIVPCSEASSFDNNTVVCVFVVPSDIDMHSHCQNLVINGYATLYSGMLATSWGSGNANTRARLLSCFDATHQML